MKRISYRFSTNVAKRKHKIYQSRLKRMQHIADTETSDMNSNFFPEQKEIDNSQIMNITLENTFHNLAEEGRKVLQNIEDYKFKLDQSANMLNSNEKAQNKLEQKKKILDSASSQLYGIVFDLENFDLTPVTYEDEQLSLTSPAFTKDTSDGPGPADKANEETNKSLNEEQTKNDSSEKSDENNKEKDDKELDEDTESAIEEALKKIDEEEEKEEKEG